MAVIDRSIYDTRDINSYFTRGIAEYDGKLWQIVDTSGVNLILHDNTGNAVVVPFNDESVQFPIPKAGCYTCGNSVIMLAREPVRQWKKVFRFRESSIDVVWNRLAQRVDQFTQADAVIYPVFANMANVHSEIIVNNRLAVAINNEFYAAVSSDGRAIELYYWQMPSEPLGSILTNGSVRLYEGTDLFLQRVRQFAEVA